MTITEEQIKNNYPLEAVRFFQTFGKYLSDEVDEYGIKKCSQDAFEAFKEISEDMPQKLRKDYEENAKALRDYLNKGFRL